MAILADLKPFSKWVHKKGGIYSVIEVAVGCGGDLEGKSLVVYEDQATRRLWVRDVVEFLDGRFTKV